MKNINMNDFVIDKVFKMIDKKNKKKKSKDTKSKIDNSTENVVKTNDIEVDGPIKIDINV